MTTGLVTLTTVALVSEKSDENQELITYQPKVRLSSSLPPLDILDLHKQSNTEDLPEIVVNAPFGVTHVANFNSGSPKDNEEAEELDELETNLVAAKASYQFKVTPGREDQIHTGRDYMIVGGSLSESTKPAGSKKGIEDPQAITQRAQEEMIAQLEDPSTDKLIEYQYEGKVLSPRAGRIQGPSGQETYYNLPMEGVVRSMRNRGYSEEEYPYWVRSDGCKMLGPYIMVAANLEIRPKGTILQCSLGTAIVADTGGFAKKNPTQLDVAVNW